MAKADIFVHRWRISAEKRAVDKGKNAEYKALYSKKYSVEKRSEAEWKTICGQKTKKAETRPFPQKMVDKFGDNKSRGLSTKSQRAGKK